MISEISSIWNLAVVEIHVDVVLLRVEWVLYIHCQFVIESVCGMNQWVQREYLRITMHTTRWSISIFLDHFRCGHPQIIRCHRFRSRLRSAQTRQLPMTLSLHQGYWTAIPWINVIVGIYAFALYHIVNVRSNIEHICKLQCILRIWRASERSGSPSVQTVSILGCVSSTILSIMSTSDSSDWSNAMIGLENRRNWSKRNNKWLHLQNTHMSSS